MARFFNTTGPCNPEDHYFLPAQVRLRNSSLDRYIEQKLYWVLHAPRQTGKTTFLQTWMRELNDSGEAVACYVTVERCQGIPEIEIALPALCDAVVDTASKMLPKQYVPQIILPNNPSSSLSDLLTQWAARCAPKPLVVLFDEVDTLEGPAMISFLRQLRGGFAARGVGKFPISIALVGMKDLRDYLAQSKDGVAVNPGSPFNVKQDSATLVNFSREEVVNLLSQHTTETGQVFEPESIESIWYWTQGQPYLVNKLADVCVEEITKRDPSCPITGPMILDAKERLIQARTTHLDALAERLKQPQVRQVIEALFTGDPEVILGIGQPGTDLCLDLGLITYDDNLGFQIANPLYREILPRSLNLPFQQSIPPSKFRWQNADGTLDMDALLKEFQRFWREHSDAWETQASYVEAFPHLLLMGFLQRILNGGGRITREYAAGRGRMDLFVEYADQGFVIEIKLVRAKKGRESTLAEALEQVAGYRASVGGPQTPTYIVLFNRTPAGRKLSWSKRTSWKTLQPASGLVTVVGG